MKKTILILVANPHGSGSLNLLPEVRNLQEAVQRSLNKERFTIEWKVAIQQEDLRRHILDIKPQIIHFCGHGTKEGLVIHDENNQVKLLSNEFLADLLKNFSDRVECLVLNACDTEPLAIEVARHLNYAIGMNQEVKDKSAIAFAEAFYDAIGAGEGIKKAFEIGKNAVLGIASSGNQSRKLTVVKEDDLSIQAQNSEHLIPVLKINPRVIIDESIMSDPIYIERPLLERFCCDQIKGPICYLQITAPKRMGKTMLVNYILDFASTKEKYKTIKIDFKNPRLPRNLSCDDFFSELCSRLSEILVINRRKNFDNDHEYFEHLLSEMQDNLVLALDSFEILFSRKKDCFDIGNFLRYFHEQAKSNNNVGMNCKKLRIIIAYSTAKMPDFPTNRSPFLNVGEMVDRERGLKGFTSEQAKKLLLIKYPQLIARLSDTDLKSLVDFLNGHPQLIQQSLLHLNYCEDTMESFLEKAPTEQGIFLNYLRSILTTLENNQDQSLIEDYKRVLSQGRTKLTNDNSFVLCNLGLIKSSIKPSDNDYISSCDLYLKYFSNQFGLLKL